MEKKNEAENSYSLEIEEIKKLDKKWIYYAKISTNFDTNLGNNGCCGVLHYTLLNLQYQEIQNSFQNHSIFIHFFS